MHRFTIGIQQKKQECEIEYSETEDIETSDIRRHFTAAHVQTQSLNQPTPFQNLNSSVNHRNVFSERGSAS